MPTSHFVDPATGVYPPPYDPFLLPDGLELEVRYGTTTPGVGLVAPRSYPPGSYISSTPVLDDPGPGVHDQLTPAARGAWPFHDMGRFQVDNFGLFYNPADFQFSFSLFFYNPHAVTIAALVWLAGPDAGIFYPALTSGGYSLGRLAGTGNPHPSQGGVLASGPGPHVPSGTVGYVHNGAEFVLDAAMAWPPVDYAIRGPDPDDPTRPIPAYAVEFVLNPGCCYPVVMNQPYGNKNSYEPDRPYAHTHDVRLVWLRKVVS